MLLAQTCNFVVNIFSFLLLNMFISMSKQQSCPGKRDEIFSYKHRSPGKVALHHVHYFPKVGEKNICGMTVAGPTSQYKAL